MAIRGMNHGINLMGKSKPDFEDTTANFDTMDSVEENKALVMMDGKKRPRHNHGLQVSCPSDSNKPRRNQASDSNKSGRNQACLIRENELAASRDGSVRTNENS